MYIVAEKVAVVNVAIVAAAAAAAAVVVVAVAAAAAPAAPAAPAEVVVVVVQIVVLTVAGVVLVVLYKFKYNYHKVSICHSNFLNITELHVHRTNDLHDITLGRWPLASGRSKYIRL